MMMTKPIEQRSCVGCRAVRPKSEMIRCVRSPSGEVSIDRSGKAQGRGAYICPSRECLAKAKKKRQFNRAFKTAVDESIYDELDRLIEVLYMS